MVVKMMRWPWPPSLSKKYDVTLVVKRMEGWDLTAAGEKAERLAVEIGWKGPKMGLGSFRRRVKRNFTKQVEVAAAEAVDCSPSSDGEISIGGAAAVEWDEEFQNVCALSPYKENVFHPWEIVFAVFNGVNQGPKKKVPCMGTALLNLAEFAARPEEKEFELSLPLLRPSGSNDPQTTLWISLSLLELRTAPETMEPLQRPVVPVMSLTQSSETVLNEKDEVSAIKAGLRKVKIFKDYVSIRRAKKACREEEGSEGKSCSRSEDEEYSYSDSLDDFEEGESDEVKEDSNVRKSFSYGTLAYANGIGESAYYNVGRNDENEDWVYYSNRISNVGSSQTSEIDPSISDPPLVQSSKRIILPWRKRKMSFRSPKAKGEPLLKKAYGEEGGDDIDFDRRQLSSDEALALVLRKTEDESCANRSSVSDFGDDNFAVGSWDQKEIKSRDGLLKLETEVFFASIDQRSERAAGESACTALVAVIADWFENNRDLMPIKSQFDSLIRDGSLEWRNLCENETYRERFPDRHFDLETVLQAKIRPLSVVASRSFVGFFHPEGMDEARFDFLQGAMSFDNIWDEINAAGCPSNGDPQLYIISWNDHFFILKVEPEAYYIIDTLGERLFEGCDQAYILKFDCSTAIRRMPDVADDKTSSRDEHQTTAAVIEPNSQDSEAPVSRAMVRKSEGEEAEEEIVCQGKESCKEYIKSFLAAIPIRELQTDIKKGLMASTPLHQRLQIEFHYTQCSPPMVEPESPAGVEIQEEERAV
ncbi:hypothetical protein LINGRAHAP2_LOCUS5085 [Linum grandiflorum]